MPSRLEPRSDAIDWARVFDYQLAVPSTKQRVQDWVNRHISAGHRVEMNRFGGKEYIFFAKGDGSIETIDVSEFPPPLPGYLYEAFGA